MSSPPPPGVYVPAVLFFQENSEDLDIGSIKAHVLRLAQGGVTGILVQGSNGEAQHLSHDERKQAIRLVRDTLDQEGFQNVCVIAGTGAQSTRETKKLCSDAQEAGASHALVLPPSTWPPQMTRDAILHFFRQVADASTIPTMIYNFPVVTAGQDLDSDIINELAAHPNIVGTKLSCGNIGKLHRVAYPHRSDFAVFSGRSDFMLTGLLSGSAGTIAALPNLVPKLHLRLYQLFKEGRLSEAFVLQAQLGQADWGVQKLGGIKAIKAIISEHFKYGLPTVRGPLLPLAAQGLQGPHYDVILSVILQEKAL